MAGCCKLTAYSYVRRVDLTMHLFLPAESNSDDVPNARTDAQVESREVAS